ncbi:MAG: hypothetical protein KY476_05560 [Planctomycetes bacterium]|nr:hypothetical protein [Planctomycetota bacterium]
MLERGVGVLEEELGPVQALRFLSLITREPFDYQQWRDQHFRGLTLADVLEWCRHQEGGGSDTP